MIINFVTGPAGSGKTFLLNRLRPEVVKLDLDDIGYRYSDLWLTDIKRFVEWLYTHCDERSQTSQTAEITIIGDSDNLYEVIRVLQKLAAEHEAIMKYFYLFNRDISDRDALYTDIVRLSRIFPNWSIIYNRFNEDFKFGKYDSVEQYIDKALSKINDDRYGFNFYVKQRNEY